LLTLQNAFLQQEQHPGLQMLLALLGPKKIKDEPLPEPKYDLYDEISGPISLSFVLPGYNDAKSYFPNALEIKETYEKKNSVLVKCLTGFSVNYVVTNSLDGMITNVESQVFKLAYDR
jgi:hypothetical protein